MKDVLPFIADLLSDTADVELAFSDGFASLPCIVLSETGNSAAVILSGEDRYSTISLQLDVYADGEKDARDIAAEASGILARRGIRRTFSQFITDEDKPRMCMRFRFGLDERTGRTVSL
ncbi:MAG: hypothetical protein J6O50_10080 [Ruminiclostridium sp.]|nr:hypothetical protein [Ruminiclostridium sp.]